jgi:hypothetical protein
MLLCYVSGIEVSCEPLLSQVLNTTETRAGTVVSVSCADKETWIHHQSKHNIISNNSLTTVCDGFGRWRPAVPECIGGLDILILQQFVLQYVLQYQ